MKRILSLLLCVVLLFSAMPMQAFASEFEVPDDESILEEDGNAQLDHMQQMLERLYKDHDIATINAGQMDVYRNLMSGIGTFNSLVAVKNNIISILQMCGVIKSPAEIQMEMLNNIYDAVLDIQNTVNQINTKTDKIQSTLNSEFSKMDYNFNLNRYDSYQKAWSDFFAQGGSVSKLQELYNDYKSQINADLIRYAESWQGTGSGGIRVLYTDNFNTITCSGKNMTVPGAALPPAPARDDDGVKIAAYITLPGNNINVDDGNLKADNVMDYLYDALTSGVSKALADGTLEVSDQGFYDTYSVLSDDEKAECEKKIVSDLLDSLLYEISYEIANTKVGVGTFASKVQSAFDTYYNTMFGKKNVTSPIYAAYQRLLLTHGFEGEIKDEVAEVSVYLSELSMLYGSFASYVTALDVSMNKSSKEAVAKEGRCTALLPLEYRNSFLTGHDNYCYPLGTVIEYHEVSACSSISYTTFDQNFYENKTNNEDWHLVDLTVDESTNAKEQESLLKSAMLSSRDVSLLYNYYLSYNSKDGESIDFLKYLKENGALVCNKAASATDEEAGYPAVLITSMPQIKSVDPKGTGAYMKMVDLVSGYDPANEEALKEKFKKEFNGAGFFDTDRYFNKSAITKETKYDIYDEYKANTFDASGVGSSNSLSGRISEDRSLVARAVNPTEFFGEVRFIMTNASNYSHEDSIPSKGERLHKLSFAQNYGVLLSVPTAKDEIRLNGSNFGKGDIWLICTASALIVVGGVAAVVINKKRKKKKQ